MHWPAILDGVLQPKRPRLDLCLAERERHLLELRGLAEARAQALAGCERRINEARQAIFEANDGVVSSLMTELEREWRLLSRRDPDAGLMDFWARVAPPSWIDRKRWRDAPADRRLDVAVALAADVDSVERAEAAVLELRVAVAVHGRQIGERIRYRPFEGDTSVVAALLEESLRVGLEACPERHRSRLLERAEEVKQSVQREALVRLQDRPLLAADIAHAALVEHVGRTVSLPSIVAPVHALVRLWETGFVLAEAGSEHVTLEIPSLGQA